MLFGGVDAAVVLDGVVVSVADGDTPCSGRYCCCTSSRECPGCRGYCDEREVLVQM